MRRILALLRAGSKVVSPFSDFPASSGVSGRWTIARRGCRRQLACCFGRSSHQFYIYSYICQYPIRLLSIILYRVVYGFQAS